MKRHSLDLVSLVFGILFTAAGLTFLISPDPWSLLFESTNLSWIFPTLVLLGGAALLFSMTTSKPSDESKPVASATSPAVESHAGTGEQQKNTEETAE